VYREKPTCGIYKIHHKDTGKSYVGLSVDIFKRWKEHSNFWEKKERWSTIKKALHKHGLENFTFTILEECLKDDLAAREIHWIKELNTQAPNGYNMTAGGDGTSTYKHTDEAKKKMTKAKQKAVVINDIEFKSIISAAKFMNKNRTLLPKYLSGERPWPEGYTGYYK